MTSCLYIFPEKFEEGKLNCFVLFLILNFVCLFVWGSSLNVIGCHKFFDPFLSMFFLMRSTSASFLGRLLEAGDGDDVGLMVRY